jgi:hypothetical protein
VVDQICPGLFDCGEDPVAGTTTVAGGRGSGDLVSVPDKGQWWGLRSVRGGLLDCGQGKSRREEQLLPAVTRDPAPGRPDPPQGDVGGTSIRAQLGST